MDLTEPFMTQAQLLKVTGAEAEWVQTWVNRGHIQLEQQNPGRGKPRRYSELDAIKIAIFSRMAAFGIAIDRTKEIAETIENVLRKDGRFEWEELLIISYLEQRRKRPTMKALENAGFLVSAGFSDFAKLGLEQDDLNNFRLSTFAEWWRGGGRSRRGWDERIIPEKREAMAREGIFAEPIFVFPIGETVNGIRLMVEKIRSAGSAV